MRIALYSRQLDGLKRLIEQLATDFAGRTRLAAFTVVLARQPSQPGAMRLWVESSLAQSLQLWLARAAALQQA